MYQVSVQTYNKKGKEMVDHITITLGSMEDEGYDEALSRLSDLLFGLDVDYDDPLDGGVYEESIYKVEKTLEGKKHLYKISGGEK